MRVVVTGAASAVGREVVAQAHADGHDVVPTCRPGGQQSPPHEPTMVACSLTHPGDSSCSSTGIDIDQLVAGADCVVHLEVCPYINAGVAAGEWLDAATRCTYNLLGAAAAAGVSRCIVVSAMEVLSGHPSSLEVRPTWKPLPTCEPAQLGPHLAEFTCREFARGTDFKVTILRIGGCARWKTSTSEAVAAIAAELAVPEEASTQFSLQPDRFNRFQVRNLLRDDGLRVVHAASETLHATGTVDEADAAITTHCHRPRSETDADPTPVKRVLLIGAGGMLGPPVANALLNGDIDGSNGSLDLSLVRITDIGSSPTLRDPDQVTRSQSTHPLPIESKLLEQAEQLSVGTKTEYCELNVVDADAVTAMARDVDAIVACHVLRHHPRHSFDVNVLGTYNTIRAAAECGHKRFINTGPGATITGSSLSPTIFDISESISPAPGLGLYGFTKGTAVGVLGCLAAFSLFRF